MHAEWYLGWEKVSCLEMSYFEVFHCTTVHHSCENYYYDVIGSLTYDLCMMSLVGVTQRCFFMDTDDRTNEIMMQTNFNAPRTLTRAVIPGTVIQLAVYVIMSLIYSSFMCV